MTFLLVSIIIKRAKYVILNLVLTIQTESLFEGEDGLNIQGGAVLSVTNSPFDS